MTFIFFKTKIIQQVANIYLHSCHSETIYNFFMICNRLCPNFSFFALDHANIPFACIDTATFLLDSLTPQIFCLRCSITMSKWAWQLLRECSPNTFIYTAPIFMPNGHYIFSPNRPYTIFIRLLGVCGMGKGWGISKWNGGQWWLDSYPLLTWSVFFIKEFFTWVLADGYALAYSSKILAQCMQRRWMVFQGCISQWAEIVLSAMDRG